MADFSAIFERLKNNKLLIPALAIGGVLGVYLLMKNGAGSSLSGSATAPDNGQSDQPQPAPVGGGTDTGTGTGDLGELQQQQQDFMSSITDLYNQLASSVQSALGAQSAQTQAALDQLANQQSAVLDQPVPQMIMSGLPDFTSLSNAYQNLPLHKNVPSMSPRLSQIGGQSLGASVTKLISKQQIATQKYVQPAPRLNISAPQNRPQIFNRIQQTTPQILNSRPSGLGGARVPNLGNLGGLSGYVQTRSANIARVNPQNARRALTGFRSGGSY